MVCSSLRICFSSGKKVIAEGAWVSTTGDFARGEVELIAKGRGVLAEVGAFVFGNLSADVHCHRQGNSRGRASAPGSTRWPPFPSVCRPAARCDTGGFYALAGPRGNCGRRAPRPSRPPNDRTRNGARPRRAARRYPRDLEQVRPDIGKPDAWADTLGGVPTN